MERILRGIMRYRHTTREQMVKEFQKVRDNPQVSEIMILFGHIDVNNISCFSSFRIMFSKSFQPTECQTHS